jgi:hypothetical protein
MKKIICTITFAILCIFMAAEKSQAQYCSYGVAYGVSAVWQSGTTVYFYSSTELDYCAGLYYDPATYGRFTEGNFATENVRLLGDGYTEGYADWIPAEIYTNYSFPINHEYYNTDTIHYVLEYYQYYTCFASCGYYWYDPWGYGFSEGIGGPGFYGYGGAGYWSVRRRRLGSTYATIQYTAPNTCQPGQQFDSSGNACPTPTPTPTPTPAATPQVTITEVGFKSDHKIKKLSDDTTIDPDDNASTWVSGRSTNIDFPVAYTKGTRPTIFAKLNVAQANSNYTTASVRVKQGSTVLATVANVNMAANGSVQISSIPFTADLSDQTMVKMSKYTFAWEISFNGSSWSSIGNSGEHEVHWLFAAPIEPTFQNPESAPNPTRTYSGLYDEALRHATAKTGSGKTDIAAIAEDVTVGVPADLTYNPRRRSEDRNPLRIYLDTDKSQQCSDNVALLRGLLRSIGVPNTTNYFWGGDPASGTERSHWFVEPGTSAAPGTGFPLGGTVTSQYPRPPLNEGGIVVPANPYFTFHSTLRVGPANKSYDPSYGVVEDEVSMIKTVNAAGTCLTGTAANAARIISTNLSHLNTGNLTDFGYACGFTASLPRSSTVLAQSVPAYMDAGLSYLVSVTLQNNGSNTWTQAENYNLGSQNPQDNYTWGLNRVNLPASVPPGGQVTFSYYVTAPYNAGTYNFQWRMVQDGVEWFGDFTPNIQINVFANPSCDPWQEQNCWNSGGSWDSSTCQCYGGGGGGCNGTALNGSTAMIMPCM